MIHSYIVCQWLATGLGFSPVTSVSSTNKTDLHDIAEILLKVMLNTINQPITRIFVNYCVVYLWFIFDIWNARVVILKHFFICSILNNKWKEKSQFIGQLEKQVQQMKDNWENKEKKLREERDKSVEAARYVYHLFFLKLYQLFTGEEMRIPFIFDDFYFCHSRVIGLDMTENRIFTLCRMITWVVFLRMFWNFMSSLPVKRVGSLSFLTIFTFAVPELLDLIWRKIGFLPYVVW